MFKHMYTMLLCGSTCLSITTEPAFEIQNKAKHTIQIAVFNGGNLVVSPKKLDALTKTERAVLEKHIQPGQVTYLAVWKDDKNQPKVEKTIRGNTTFNPAPHALYKFTPGKTIYLTWDDKDFARPQTGPLFGLKGKTETGYSLKNNVKKEDIKAVAYNAHDGIKLEPIPKL